MEPGVKTLDSGSNTPSQNLGSLWILQWIIKPWTASNTPSQNLASLLNRRLVFVSGFRTQWLRLVLVAAVIYLRCRQVSSSEQLRRVCQTLQGRPSVTLGGHASGGSSRAPGTPVGRLLGPFTDLAPPSSPVAPLENENPSEGHYGKRPAEVETEQLREQSQGAGDQAASSEQVPPAIRA